jgi:CheY-like chemotaxis protein
MHSLELDWRRCMWNGKPINEKLVLVVDDDRSMRESLAGLLDVKGYSVLAGFGKTRSVSRFSTEI